MNPYSPLKIYIASRWDDRDDALIIKKMIEEVGHQCTSTWLTPHDNQSMDALKEQKNVVSSCREKSIKDFEDIDACDVFLVYSPKKGFRNGTGGKHVELGYALARGKVCFLIGERENIFHYHPLVRVKAGIAAFLEEINE